HFGEGAEDSFLKIDNIVIPSTLCSEWKNEKIILSSNMISDGGLLFVIAKNSYSKPIFISSTADIPVVKLQENNRGKPSIDALSKDNGEIGSLIKIYGSNFGAIKEDSDVIFIKGYDEKFSILPDERDLENIVYCSDKDFDFDFWSDEEVHIRIPDGADSGLIAVKTKNGISNTIPFNIKGKIGIKSLKNKETLLISMETEISNVKADSTNTLFLRIPLPENTNSQSNIKILFNAPSPLVQNHNEETIYQFDNIKEDAKISVKQQYSATTYEILNNINVHNVSTKINNQKLYDYYTKETTLLPVNDAQIKILAASIVGTERNPYNKAKKIYEYIITNFNIVKEISSSRSKTVLSMLEDKTGSPYDISLLFSTLCRINNIPCVSIAGVVMNNENKSHLHWWNEFYINGYGWIPLDIGMAMDIPFANEIKNKRVYYFGNLDANRISFSHGEKEILQITANGKVYSRERNFALQSFWEEASNIDSYTCFWHVPQINKIN
ncbi:MAG: transglutaminase-like domain-containing protein, partial [Treponema sp.]